MISTSPSTTAASSSGETRPRRLPIRVVDRVRTWPILIHDSLGSFALPIGTYTRATTDYGITFSSVVEQDNFFGTQFHPERSAGLGERILENFLRI